VRLVNTPAANSSAIATMGCPCNASDTPLTCSKSGGVSTDQLYRTRIAEATPPAYVW